MLIAGRETVRKAVYFGRKTNNEAEYLALIEGLRIARGRGRKLKIFMDSQLIVRQLRGEYRVKSEKLRLLHERAKALLMEFDWTVEHVPREQNSEADRLANLAIDRKGTVVET